MDEPFLLGEKVGREKNDYPPWHRNCVLPGMSGSQKEASVSEKIKKNDGGGTGTPIPSVKWDDSAMASAYANVCNVTSTKEEFTLLFGTNQALYPDQRNVTIKLSNRMILNPYAAKRLYLLLGHVMGQYEARFGQLNVGAPPEATEK
jgi:hypothetical protein